MEEEYSFDETIMTLGLVVRGNYETIKEIKEFLSQLPDCKVIYQRNAFGRLYITNKPSGSSIPEGEDETE
jgi:hypothetical protein